MNGILWNAVDRTLHLIDTAALGFAAATPMITDFSGDAHAEPKSTGN